MILCACSPYFKNLLEQNPAKHPIIILKVINHLSAYPPTCLSSLGVLITSRQDVPFAHLTAILEFMYAGEVTIRAPIKLRISEFFFFSFYSILLSDFQSHLGKWIRLVKIEAEYEHFHTWKVEKPQSTTSLPSFRNVYVI